MLRTTDYMKVAVHTANNFNPIDQIVIDHQLTTELQVRVKNSGVLNMNKAKCSSVRYMRWSDY